jgi:hypothetical protein
MMIKFLLTVINLFQKKKIQKNKDEKGKKKKKVKNCATNRAFRGAVSELILCIIVVPSSFYNPFFKRFYVSIYKLIEEVKEFGF